MSILENATKADCEVVSKEIHSQPSSRPNRWRQVALGATLALTAWACQAQTGSSVPDLPGTANIDASGNTQQERSACMNGQTQQDQATCLREANNAAADKRQGQLSTESPSAANAIKRCEPLAANDRAACEARVLGGGTVSGSVAGGGVLRQVETVELPPGTTSVVIQRDSPSSKPVLVLPAPQ